MATRLTSAPMAATGNFLSVIAAASRHVQLPLRASRYLSELWACVVCPDLVFHVFSPDGARIYMDELIRVRDASSGIQIGSWSPKNVGTGAK